MKVAQWLASLLVGGVGLLLAGCGTPMAGSPSLTVLSSEWRSSSPQIKVVGPPSVESDTLTWFLLFGFSGPMIQSHEAALDRLLARYNADLLVDAEMEISQYGIPYLFMQLSATVRGRPAVFVQGGEK
jgi:hypothetical protein